MSKRIKFSSSDEKKKKRKKRGKKYTLKVSIVLPTGSEVVDFFDGIRRGLTERPKKTRW